jgi:hypothetical protein
MACDAAKTVDALQNCIAVLEMLKDNWGTEGRNSAKMFVYKKHTPCIKYYKHLQTTSFFNLTRTANCILPINTSEFCTVFHK